MNAHTDRGLSLPDFAGSARKASSVLLAVMLTVNTAFAQSAIRIDAPVERHGSWLTRPYQARYIPPINLANTSRLDSLVKAGNLYLSAQDVVALVLENNLDIEVQRYGPLLAREVLRRAQGGGLLRSVGQGVASGPTSVSLAGVSINTNGSPPVTSSGVNSSVLTQLGPSIPTFDGSITAFTNFAHTTTPQSNTSFSGTQSLVFDTRTLVTSYSQNSHFGTSATISYTSQYQRVNSTFFS